MTWILVGLATAHAQALPSGNPDAGAEVYATACAGCHAPDGTGATALAAVGARPARLDRPRTLRRLGEDGLTRVVRDGGPAVGRSPLMPAFADTLTEEELRDVIAWVEVLAAPDASDVWVADVGD